MERVDVLDALAGVANSGARLAQSGSPMAATEPPPLVVAATAMLIQRSSPAQGKTPWGAAAASGCRLPMGAGHAAVQHVVHEGRADHLHHGFLLRVVDVLARPVRSRCCSATRIAKAPMMPL